MKYKITKNENGEFSMIVLVDTNGNIVSPPGNFAYIDFINFLYNHKGQKIEFDFDGLSNEEKNKIRAFMDGVYKIFDNKDPLQLETTEDGK